VSGGLEGVVVTGGEVVTGTVGRVVGGVVATVVGEGTGVLVVATEPGEVIVVAEWLVLDAFGAPFVLHPATTRAAHRIGSSFFTGTSQSSQVAVRTFASGGRNLKEVGESTPLVL
jgi:hypothetical protein